jgi:dienelactone hydrolase
MAGPLSAGVVLCAFLSCAAVLAQELPDQYREPFAKSFPIRKQQHLQMKAYLDSFPGPRAVAPEAEFKLDFSSVQAYEESVGRVRQQLQQAGGYPPPKAVSDPKPRFELVAKDKGADIYRVWTEVLEGVEAYGIYMVPRGLNAKAPMIIAVHGGSGCPEAVCDLDTRVNYHAFGREAVKRGYIVYAPGFCMNVSYAEPPDPDIEGAGYRLLGEKATEVGTDMRTLQMYEVVESTKAIAKARPEVDADRIGMTGLSMGGGYTLVTMANAPFIKAGVVSAAFGVREGAEAPKDEDMGTLKVHGRLSNPQMVALICPRPLMIQSGVKDTVVPVEGARRGVPMAAAYYKKLGIEDRFEFNEHEGEHVFENGAIMRFFDKHLR